MASLVHEGAQQVVLQHVTNKILYEEVISKTQLN